MSSYGEVTFDIGLDEELAHDAEIAMFTLADYTEHLAVPLFAARRTAMDDMQAHFDSETDPAGAHWTELDEEYKESKIAAGYPENILQRTGALMAAATSDPAFMIVGDTLFFNPDVLPRNEAGDNYGMYHQTGSGEENIGDAAEHRGRVKAGAYEGTRGVTGHQSLDIGSGNALPRRAFIGLSDPAVAEIDSIFEAWYANASRVFVNPITGVAQERNALGQFGRRIR